VLSAAEALAEWPTRADEDTGEESREPEYLLKRRAS
jgi:hypothetical protein